MVSLAVSFMLSLISGFEEMFVLMSMADFPMAFSILLGEGIVSLTERQSAWGFLPLTEVLPGEALLATSIPHTLPVLRRQQELQSIYVI